MNAKAKNGQEPRKRKLFSVLLVAVAFSFTPFVFTADVTKGRTLTDGELEVVGKYALDLSAKRVVDHMFAKQVEIKVQDLQKAPQKPTTDKPSAADTTAIGGTESAEHGMGKFVVECLAGGMHGPDLANAIHKEESRRGVGKGHGKPGGPDGQVGANDHGKPAGAGGGAHGKH